MRHYQYLIINGTNRQPIEITEFAISSTSKDLIPISENAKNLFPGLSSTAIDELQKLKIEFIKKGFATYTDAEALVRLILRKNPIILQKIAKRFPTIIVDECQDLSQSQISTLEELRAAGVKLHFVGDLNQAIYEFRDIDPEDVRKYIVLKNFTKFA